MPKLNDLEGLVADATHRRISSAPDAPPPTPYEKPLSSPIIPPNIIESEKKILTFLDIQDPISSPPKTSSPRTSPRLSPPTSPSSTPSSRRPNPTTPSYTSRSAASARRLRRCSTRSRPPSGTSGAQTPRWCLSWTSWLRRRGMWTRLFLNE